MTTVNIFWSSEDAGFIAVDMTRPGCSAFGETKAESMRELADARAAWDEAKARTHQKPECICERGHDRPYWTCPKHGYVVVDT